MNINYQIKRGDTLTAISKRFGVPINVLVGANGILDPNYIRAGDSLTIPLPDPTPRFQADVKHIDPHGDALESASPEALLPMVKAPLAALAAAKSIPLLARMAPQAARGIGARGLGRPGFNNILPIASGGANKAIIDAMRASVTGGLPQGSLQTMGATALQPNPVRDVGMLTRMLKNGGY